MIGRNPLLVEESFPIDGPSLTKSCFYRFPPGRNPLLVEESFPIFRDEKGNKITLTFIVVAIPY